MKNNKLLQQLNKLKVICFFLALIAFGNLLNACGEGKHRHLLSDGFSPLDHLASWHYVCLRWKGGRVVDCDGLENR